MANLAEAIQGLVAHMRTEQQMIREWADGQGEQNREIKKLLERIARQPEKSYDSAPDQRMIARLTPTAACGPAFLHRGRDTIAEKQHGPRPCPPQRLRI